MVLKRRKKKLLNSESVSVWKEISDVLRLTFTMTTPPHFYYTYRLYLYSRAQWWDFIFTHEVNAWHSQWNAEISEKARRLMQDKKMFADYGLSQGFPTISTKKLEDISCFLLTIKNTPQFIKPRIGSRNEKGYAITALAKSGAYSVVSPYVNKVFSKSKLLSWLAELCNEDEFIYQDLLENSNQVERFTNTNRLITFRIVSVVVEGIPKILAATMELPVGGGYMLPVMIDRQDGSLTLPELKNAKLSEKNSDVINCEGTVLSIWPDLKRVALSAHSGVLDVPTIGWDLVHTENGCYLLEGNLNWGVAPHQLTGPNLMPEFILLFNGKRNKP